MPIGSYRAGIRTVREISIYVRSVYVTSVQADVSPPVFERSEEGDVTNATVAVVFSEAIFSADFTTGPTIKINGVAATILSATKQADPILVYYVLQAPYADANDLITFEYSDVAGDYADTVGNQMADVSATSITNNVGSHWRFDDAPNSMHLAYW
jgi:hypothetical protein